MAIDNLQDTVSNLQRSAHALAAVGAALDARLSGKPLEPALEPHVNEVLAALGIERAIDEAPPIAQKSMLGEIRTYTLTNAKLLFAASRVAGWDHREPELLQAAGDVSTTVPHSLKGVLAAKLDGLAERLAAPNAAFLDIGVGVAALSIEMARVWPALRVVGIDVWGPALELARDNVRTAGLEHRIALREQRAEQLPDFDAFDLAWIPSIFVAEAVLPLITRRVLRALRPGGWLLFPTMKHSEDRLERALLRLRWAMFGGSITTAEKIESLLREEGFEDVGRMPGPAHAVAVMIAARKSPAAQRAFALR